MDSLGAFILTEFVFFFMLAMSWPKVSAWGSVESEFCDATTTDVKKYLAYKKHGKKHEKRAVWVLVLFEALRFYFLNQAREALL